MGDTAHGSRVGTRFGPYLLRRLLGVGGMGEVYEAEDIVKDRVVALKLMSRELSSDPVFRKRMQREARTAGRLQEPHVVPIHNYGEIDGQLYIDMRLIDGTDLGGLVRLSGPLPPPRAVAIVRQVASALDAAHTAGVMHRDVKPGNVLITSDDFAYLVDFGITAASTDEHLTETGSTVGTWRYMAPERFTGAEVTSSVDVYALACVLYESLTGSPPYRVDSFDKLVTAHLTEPIPKPSRLLPGIPNAFDEVIARGMAKSPEARYASAGDLARAAQAALSTPDRDHAADIVRRSMEATLLGTEPIPTGPPAMPHPPTTTRRPEPLPDSVPPPTHRPIRTPGSGPIQTFISGPPPTAATGGIGGWAGQFRANPPQPGGPPPWSRPAPRRPNPWLLLGIAALVVVAVLGGLGIWRIDKPDPVPTAPVSAAPVTSPATTPTSVPGTSSTPSAPTSAPTRQLMSQLPLGYPPGTCTPTVPQRGTAWETAAATVECGQNTQPGGPPDAVFGLFPNTDSLRQAFTADIRAVSVTPCPGSRWAPGNWNYNDNPNVSAGAIACATYQAHPKLIWSNEEKLMLADVSGDPPTIEDLHQWWQGNG